MDDDANVGGGQLTNLIKFYPNSDAGDVTDQGISFHEVPFVLGLFVMVIPIFLFLGVNLNSSVPFYTFLLFSFSFFSLRYATKVFML